MLGPTRFVNSLSKRFFHQTTPVFGKWTKLPKGERLPPEHPTCAYVSPIYALESSYFGPCGHAYLGYRFKFELSVKYLRRKPIEL